MTTEDRRREDETEWLSETEMRAWLGFWRAMRVVDDAIDRDLRSRMGLSHGEYQILAMLSASPERSLRMSTLANMVLVTRSRLTYQVTQLEKTGFVRREECPSDKRGAIAVLTDKGMNELHRAAPGHVECVRRVFFDALTPEQVVVLGDALTSIADRQLQHPPTNQAPSEVP